MKIKQNVFITDPVDFARGRLDWCFTLLGADIEPGYDWIKAGTIELDVSVDTQTAVMAATKAIDAQEEKVRAEFNARLAQIDRARSELLAITHVPEQPA